MFGLGIWDLVMLVVALAILAGIVAAIAFAVYLLVRRTQPPMAGNLLACPECGGGVSRLANACPHCGRPLEPRLS